MPVLNSLIMNDNIIRYINLEYLAAGKNTIKTLDLSVKLMTYLVPSNLTWETIYKILLIV
jgi:hypothetical protein